MGRLSLSSVYDNNYRKTPLLDVLKRARILNFQRIYYGGFLKFMVYLILFFGHYKKIKRKVYLLFLFFFVAFRKVSDLKNAPSRNIPFGAL